MPKTIIFFCLLLASKANARSFTINNKTIEIPTPVGFVEVTVQMSSIYKLTRYLAPDNNELLMCYIPEADAKIAKVGKLPKMEYVFYILLNEKFKEGKISTKYFNELATTITNKINNKTSLIDESYTNFIEKISKSICNDFDLDIKIKFSQQTSYLPHYRTDNIFSYSMHNRYQITSKHNDEYIVGAKTTTTINIAGKILNLICEAPDKKLEWSRDNSIAWAESILKNNSLLIQQYYLSNTDSYLKKLSRTIKATNSKALAIIASGLVIFIIANIFATNI